VNAGQRFFGFRASADDPYGIYKNATVNFSGAAQVVAPTYAAIISLQMSNDGNTLYYVAATPGAETPKIYKVAVTGGTPVALDSAEDAHLNSDGTMLVYSKLAADFTTEVWKRGVNAGDTPVRLTTSPGEDEFVQWSKDGTKIAFSSSRSGSFQVFTMNADGSGQTAVTGNASADDVTPSFNSDGSKLCFLSLGDGGISTVTTINSTGVDSGRTPVKSANDLLFGTYWTSSNGRSIGITSVLAQRLRKLHKH